MSARFSTLLLIARDGRWLRYRPSDQNNHFKRRQDHEEGPSFLTTNCTARLRTACGDLAQRRRGSGRGPDSPYREFHGGLVRLLPICRPCADTTDCRLSRYACGNSDSHKRRWAAEPVGHRSDRFLWRIRHPRCPGGRPSAAIWRLSHGPGKLQQHAFVDGGAIRRSHRCNA